ncbi:MAG: glycosyltransferase family 4 protein [Candidatus Micrarchaeia archaeon]
MKIAFAYESAYPWFNGGVEKRRYNILEALSRAKGNDLHMFTLYRPGMPGREFVYRGVKYHCVGDALEINKMYTQGRRTLHMSVKFALLVFFRLFKYKFDLIDTDAFPFLHVPLIYLYSKLTGAKLAITWHEVWSKDFWKGYLKHGGSIGFFFESLTAKLADVCIANSSTTKQLLNRIFKVDPKKIILFPAAVDAFEIEKFLKEHSNKCRKQDKFVVVNRLIQHKRVDIAIKAMKNVNAKLVIVGKGPELSNLKKVAKKEGVEQKVVFKQNLSLNQLYKEMCTSMALIMPSEREGLSLVTVEALALGLPVVIADTSSLPSELRQLCSEAKEDKLGLLLNDVLTNYQKYETKYTKIKETAMKQFSNLDAQAVYADAIKIAENKKLK